MSELSLLISVNTYNTMYSLAKSITELKTRREEANVQSQPPVFIIANDFKHIHELLIERAELGAERIVFLESQVSELY